MKLEEDQITKIVEETWRGMFGLASKPVEARAPVEPATVDPDSEVELTVVGIDIVGEVEASLAVECSITLVRKLAAIMFAIDETDVSPDDARDAFRELANVLGGGITEALPGNSSLSIATIGCSAKYKVRPSKYVDCIQIDHECDGVPFTIKIFSSNTGMETESTLNQVAPSSPGNRGNQ